jgi:hypothetical protein
VGYDRRHERMAEGAPRLFKLSVSDELLNQTKKKLESARFPDDIADGWEDGTPSSEVRRLRDFWLNSYDWRSEETRINNELPQYKQAVNVTDWGSLDLHFVHKRSSRTGALPLIFIHGCNSPLAMDLICIQGQAIFSKFEKFYHSLLNQQVQTFKPFMSCNIILDSLL